MELYDVKINGLVDPVGYDLHSKIVSWKVKDTDSARQENVRIDVAESPEFDSLVYSTEGADLRQSGTPLAFSCRPERRYYYRISVWGDTGDSAVSETHYFETGPAKWSAPWIGCKNEKALKSHPLFRKRFFSERKVRRARCYISAAGLYQAFLNGEKIGKEYLTPFLNDYQTGLQFQT